MSAFEELKNKLENEDLLGNVRRLKKGEFLKMSNTVDTNLYFIAKGCVRVFFVDEENEHILYFGYKGSLITALDSFIIQETSKLCIQILRETEVHTISQERFSAFIKGNTENQNLWQDVLKELIVMQTQREMDLLVSSPQKRYENALHARPDLFQEIPNKYIASYLRMSAETLSRVKNS